MRSTPGPSLCNLRTPPMLRTIRPGKRNGKYSTVREKPNDGQPSVPENHDHIESAVRTSELAPDSYIVLVRAAWIFSYAWRAEQDSEPIDTMPRRPCIRLWLLRRVVDYVGNLRIR